MNQVFRIFLCLMIGGVTLYAFIDKQNEVIEMRLAVPILAKKVRALREETSRLRYEIDQFESPIHLMELSRKPEFSHLKYPTVDSVVIVPSGERVP